MVWDHTRKDMYLKIGDLKLLKIKVTENGEALYEGTFTPLLSSYAIAA